MDFKQDDGGRAATGRRGRASDCVTRAIAIAAELPYDVVYDRLAEGNATQRRGKYDRRITGKRSADNGVNVGRKWFKDYMASLGFVWVPTMAIGQGTKVHLKNGEMPRRGRLVVQLSRHMCAVVNGVVHDTYNPDRDGTRCVYGYWRKVQ